MTDVGVLKSCPNCGSTNVTVTVERQDVPMPEGDLSLCVFAPVLTCAHCGEAFTDDSSESIRDKAAQKFMTIIRERNDAKLRAANAEAMVDKRLPELERKFADVYRMHSILLANYDKAINDLTRIRAAIRELVSVTSDVDATGRLH